MKNFFIVIMALLTLVACNGGEPNVGGDDPITLQNEIPEEPEPEPIFTLMDTFDFGEAGAVVEHNEDFNIYINFTEDGRIFVRESEEGEIGWLMSTAEGAATRHLEVFEIRDTVTDKPFYCLRFFFAGAPYDSNRLFFFDTEIKLDVPLNHSRDVKFTDYTIATREPMFSDEGEWLIGSYVTTIYEFHDGVLTPVEYIYEEN